MARIILSIHARKDVDEIWLFIAAHRVTAADKLIDRFDHAMKLLSSHPGMGQARDDLMPGLRSYPVGNYLILYRPVSGNIEVARIAHGARDIGELFKE